MLVGVLVTFLVVILVLYLINMLPLAASTDYDQRALDCGYRILAYDFAKVVQPWLDAESQAHVFDSLELSKCNQSFVATPPTAIRSHDVAHDAIRVSSKARGDGDGSAARPFASSYCFESRDAAHGQEATDQFVRKSLEQCRGEILQRFFYCFRKEAHLG